MVQDHMALKDNNISKRPGDIYFNQNLRWETRLPVVINSWYAEYFYEEIYQ